MRLLRVKALAMTVVGEKIASGKGPRNDSGGNDRGVKKATGMREGTQALPYGNRELFTIAEVNSPKHDGNFYSQKRIRPSGG